jgi:hypothetical protein
VPTSQSANSNNTSNGDIQITIQAGGARPVLNSLVIIGIDVVADVNGVFPTVTPPEMSAGHPAWNLITTTSVGSSPVNMVQYLYWHVIGSAETSIAPSFIFTLTGDGQPPADPLCDTPDEAGCFRATGIGINYLGSCTQDTPMCPTNGGSPITGVTVGTTTDSNSVTTSGTVAVPANGIALGAYGSDSPALVFFGQSGSPSGAVTDGCTSGNCSTPLHFENSNAGINAGLVIYDQLELNGFAPGPFSGTLPNNDIGNNIVQGIGIIPQ